MLAFQFGVWLKPLYAGRSQPVRGLPSLRRLDFSCAVSSMFSCSENRINFNPSPGSCVEASVQQLRRRRIFHISLCKFTFRVGESVDRR